MTLGVNSYIFIKRKMERGIFDSAN